MDAFQNTGQPDWDWWGRLWPAPGETLRRLGLTPGDAVAEIGCGNGYFALPAARIADPGTVYAIDLDRSVLDELSHLAGEQGVENVEIVEGDARDLSSHLPEPVDFALVANTFHGVDDAASFVTQVVDSLRPGGRFVVVNWRDLPRESTTVGGDPRGPPTELRLSPEETATTVLEAADASLVERVDLPPYHYAMAFER